MLVNTQLTPHVIHITLLCMYVYNQSLYSFFLLLFIVTTAFFTSILFKATYKSNNWLFTAKLISNGNNWWLSSSSIYSSYWGGYS